ncbi:hypothetical protein B5E84_17235 [Lachnoclostridium sp. An14]|nr:hypothetical protein B5E84_17235 [Lachnoclostridium sp. An14]
MKEPQSRDFDTARHLHKEIIEELGTDPDALELYEELLAASVKYAGFRARWLLLSREEKAEQDASRTASHDALIVKCNQLARYLIMQGKEAGWREALGYEENDRYNRKRLGDFGCFLAFVNGINGR